MINAPASTIPSIIGPRGKYATDLNVYSAAYDELRCNVEANP